MQNNHLQQQQQQQQQPATQSPQVEPVESADASATDAAAVASTNDLEATKTTAVAAPSGTIDQVIALYDFKSTTPETISFNKDAIINIVEKSGDWWMGEYNGKIGILPYNYVQSISKANG